MFGMTLFHFICVSALIHSDVLPLNTLTALLQVVNYISMRTNIRDWFLNGTMHVQNQLPVFFQSLY